MVFLRTGKAFILHAFPKPIASAAACHLRARWQFKCMRPKPRGSAPGAQRTGGPVRVHRRNVRWRPGHVVCICSDGARRIAIGVRSRRDRRIRHPHVLGRTPRCPHPDQRNEYGYDPKNREIVHGTLRRIRSYGTARTIPVGNPRKNDGLDKSAHQKGCNARDQAGSLYTVMVP
jgi:hypothetical protein